MIGEWNASTRARARKPKITPRKEVMMLLVLSQVKYRTCPYDKQPCIGFDCMHLRQIVSRKVGKSFFYCGSGGSKDLIPQWWVADEAPDILDALAKQGQPYVNGEGIPDVMDDDSESVDVQVVASILEELLAN